MRPGADSTVNNESALQYIQPVQIAYAPGDSEMQVDVSQFSPRSLAALQHVYDHVGDDYVEDLGDISSPESPDRNGEDKIIAPQMMNPLAKVKIRQPPKCMNSVAKLPYDVPELGGLQIAEDLGSYRKRLVQVQLPVKTEQQILSYSSPFPKRDGRQDIRHLFLPVKDETLHPTSSNIMKTKYFIRDGKLILKHQEGRLIEVRLNPYKLPFPPRKDMRIPDNAKLIEYWSESWVALSKENSLFLMTLAPTAWQPNSKVLRNQQKAPVRERLGQPSHSSQNPGPSTSREDNTGKLPDQEAPGPSKKRRRHQGPRQN